MPPRLCCFIADLRLAQATPASSASPKYCTEVNERSSTACLRAACCSAAVAAQHWPLLLNLGSSCPALLPAPVFLSGRKEFRSLRGKAGSSLRPEWDDHCRLVHEQAGWQTMFWDRAAVDALVQQVRRLWELRWRPEAWRGSLAFVAVCMRS